ncbi:MAG: FAD-dependent oxidoreductase [Candidatus Sericytochromatia bacterium]|nr:FAD-dependent oxidoreductase [Candidatus Sericytochromatia bacterium]
MTATPFWKEAPRERLEQNIHEQKVALSATSAASEANRCLYCYDAPCVQACPTAINIPEFIRRIANGNLAGAAKTIFEANILGHSCARVCPVEVLCAGSCVFLEKDEPAIMIGRLQRHATDHALKNGLRFSARGTDTGKRIALIGAGPASLAAAYNLSLRGHACVIFEGRSMPGGLNTTGVAPYKLQTDVSLEEVDYILGIGGIEVQANTWIGRDISFQALEDEFDAIFIGVGLGPDSRLQIPGENLPGSVGAVELIERIKNENGFHLNGIDEAVVIGGGNTAIDIARELKQLGIDTVTMVYRRAEESMSGYAHELAQAKQEGVRLQFGAVPLAVEGDAKAAQLRCAKVDALLQPIPGQIFSLPATLIVRATGQEKLQTLLMGITGLEFYQGRVKVNPLTQQTSHPKYFAGGDCVNGGKEVVNAAAEGKRAAEGIHAYLTSHA